MTYETMQQGNDLLNAICKLADKKTGGVTPSYPYQLGYLMGLWSTMMTEEQIAELERFLATLKLEMAEKEAA